MKQIKTIELFAGVGGFRLGLEKSSELYDFIWANQWEPSMQEQHAYNCYVSHFGKNNHICKDIAKAKNEIPDHDLLTAGFPCQDYSIMKKNSRGIEGKKGILWWQIDDILNRKKPKYIILENVDRIIVSPAKQRGRDFSIILRCLYEKGYSVEWRVINAADYGNAQRRRRTFIVAYHNQTDIFKKIAEGVCHKGLQYMHNYIFSQSVLAKAFPVLSHNKIFTDSWIDEMVYCHIQDLSSQHKVDLYNAGLMMNGRIYSVDVYPKIEPFIPLRDVIEKDHVDEHYFLREEDLPRWKYAKGSKKELRTRKDGNQYWFTEGSVQFPDSLNKPSRTMITSESEVGRSSHVIIDQQSGRLRTLTPLECERLNGFPDNWTNTGMPEKMRYFCMGNALVVPLVTRIGNSLLAKINSFA